MNYEHNSLPIYKFPSDKVLTLNKKLDTESKEFLERVGLWASYYRLFPFVFVTDYLGIHLKLFQCFILYLMMHYEDIAYIATRG